MEKIYPGAEGRVTHALKQWLKQEERDTEIDEDVDDYANEVRLGVEVDGQPYLVYLTACDQDEWFSVSLNGHILVPPEKFNNLLRLLNKINSSLYLGRIYCSDDGEDHVIHFESRIEFENGVVSVSQIDNLVKYSIRTLAKYGEIIAKIEKHEMSLEELWKKFVADNNEEAKSAE